MFRAVIRTHTKRDDAAWSNVVPGAGGLPGMEVDGVQLCLPVIG